VTEPSSTHRVTRRRALTVAAGGVAAGAIGSASPAWGRSSAAGGRSRHGSADLVLRNGQVLTLAHGYGVAQAVAIRNGRVVHAGDDRSLRRLIGRHTEVVDLKGRTALPGINDSHLHGVRTGLSLPPYNIDVGPSAVSSIADIAHAVEAAVAQVAPGAWIRGKGWNESTFAEGRPPHRQDLDAVSPDNPVALLDWSNHQLWANSKALEVAGVTAQTEAPPGGVIVKDASGEPTGLFFETAMGLINDAIPPYTTAEQADALENNISLLLSHGITSYTEPGIGATALGVYEAMAAAGTLRIRVTGLLSRADDTYPVNREQVREILAGHRRSPAATRRWFNVAGVKLRADGVPIASRTAWMREPYVGGGRGSLVTAGATDEEKVAELTAMIRLVADAGLQVGTHATGDAAIDAVAAAYAGVARPGRGGLRHYVIHGDFTHPETLRMLARSGCSVSLNPNIKHLIADGQPAVVGDERAAYQVPYASALRAGVVVTSASDAPNVAPAWLQGLETILLREGTSGAVSGPEERIGLLPALRSYTSAGAWQDGAERWKGSLAPGKAGDVCVLSERLLDHRGNLGVPARELSDLSVDLTVVGGDIAYDADSAADRRAASAARAVSWAAHPHPQSMCASC
jgi:predicted amidohydrolase YtcJ